MDDLTEAAVQNLAADEGHAPWREPVRGGHPDPALAARPGIDQLRAMLSGETPAPPLSRLIGMQGLETDPGTATFTLPLTEWLCAADARIPLGMLTIPADAAMACAIIAELPASTAITTSELALRQLRPARPGSTLRSQATVVDAGPPVALAEVSLIDEAGMLIARGSSLCVWLTASADPAEDDAARAEDAAAPGAGDGTPDPWERPPPDPRRFSAGALTPLTGLRAVAAARGEARFALPATRWLCAPPPGRVQGGVVALLADAAITAAIHSANPAAGTFVPIELKLNYLRPLASDGRDAQARAAVIHAGRRIAVAGAEVTDADGRAIAAASGSAMASPETSRLP
jgi:uncharacterized protein (TIGR00369 family)